MADTNKKVDFDIFIAQSIYPEAASIFTSHLKSLEEIKDDCYIVLDTNVLLALYITGEENLLDQCRKTYSSLVTAKRLVVPGQVAREFAKNRQEKLAELYQQLTRKKQFQQLQKGKYPLLSPLSEYKEVVKFEVEIDKKVREYQKAVDKVLAQIKGWQWDDPVSLLYHEIFTEDTVVDIPVKEEEVKKDLQRRQQHGIPPGYKDGGKNDAGIGDLLIWYTILDIGKTRKKSVIFVSNEEKADWYTRSEGQPLYPRYELVDEFKRESGGQSFHIVKLSRFLELYGANEQVVEEIKKEEKLQTALSNVSVTLTEPSHLNFSQAVWENNLSIVLRTFLELWTAYGGVPEKLIDPYFSMLQNKILQLSDQLINLISVLYNSISVGDLLLLRKISSDLIELGTMQFYLDGGISVKKFNDLGENIVNNIRLILDHLK